ncbi:hypothetical protein DDE82_003480 [Stemphylium lycopersici]|nr:hypothetical protein DDE82_003480 [Stemphylium lycopersici]
MSRHTPAPVFMNLPLEVRHTIFEHASARGTEPKKLLRYWFEKKEAKELVAQEVANNPNGPAPRIVYNENGYDCESDTSEVDGEDENEDEGEEDEEDEDEEDDEDEIDEPGAQEEDEQAYEDNETQLSSPTSAQTTTAAQPHTQATAGNDQDKEAAEDLEHGGGETQSGDDGDEDDADESEHEEETAGADGNADTTTSTVQPPPPTPVVRPLTKWRHILNFMRLTHCPPPLELLLASKQLNNEAKNWFYDVAVLRINATGSFAHTSFFEEAFSQITHAAFSPMENIRKVEVTFAWDSTWIRADTTGCVEDIFPALLGQRAIFVHQILLQAPDLREVLIQWHDSAQDNESASLMLETLAPFHTLPATVKIEEHYINAEAKPRKHTVAGKRRVEFQNILDIGLDRLF